MPNPRSLERSLDDLGLPVRIVNAANARGLYTLREFLGLSPATFTTERNIGRKTLVETERALKKALGVTWHEAWSKLAGPATRTSMPPAAPDGESFPARWTRLALYPQLASVTVRELALPTRMKNHAAREGFVSAADLVRRSWTELLQSERLGRGTMQKTLEILEGALATVSRPDPIAPLEHWRDAFVAMLEELDGNDRTILRQRAGLVGEVPTLAQIGETLGISRERVRQIEERAKQRLQQRAERLPFGARLRELVGPPWTLLTELGDPFFAAEPEDEPAYAIFLAAIDPTLHLVSLDDRACLTRLPDAPALWARAEQVPATLEFPLPEAELAPRFADAMPCSEADARAFIELLGPRFLRHDAEVRGFGTRREDGVIAYLRAQPGPVHRSDLETHLGRGVWPDDVVLLDRGMLTLRDRVPDWSTWAARAGQLAARAMQEAPDRHFTTHELVPLIEAQADVPAWFNPWSLGALLKESPLTQYLGRNVVALAGEPEVRTFLVDAVRVILERAGAPLPEREVHDQILQSRGLTETTWSLLRLRAPFLLMDGNLLGLAPRDVPGGQAALDTVVASLARVLAEEQVGWERAEVERFIHDFGPPYSSWGQRLVRSVLRLSGLFRLTRGGGLGLAEWDHARIPVHIAGHDLRAHREPTSAEVRASLLERWLVSLPDRAAAQARELAKESHEHLDDDLRTWASELRAMAGWKPAVEPAQVERMIARATELRALPVGRRLEPLVRAALRYVCVAVAERDETMVGTLDDDEAVLVVTLDFAQQA